DSPQRRAVDSPEGLERGLAPALRIPRRAAPLTVPRLLRETRRMKAHELEVGKTSLLALTPAAGAAFPDGLRLREEVRLWKDAASGALMLAQGEVVCIVRELPEHSTQLDDLCTGNLPRMTWLMDRKRLPAGERLCVQVHQFSREFVPALDVAV